MCRSLSVPIYMVFPRLFTCPTLETTNFRVGKRPAPSPHGRGCRRPAGGPPGAWDRHTSLLGSGTAPSTPPPAPREAAVWGRGGTQGGRSDPGPVGQGRADGLCGGNYHEGQASSVPLTGWHSTDPKRDKSVSFRRRAAWAFGGTVCATPGAHR